MEGYRDAIVHYTCRCSHRGVMSLSDGAKISGKLVWKVDWPMRWAHEGISFEPVGEDHHAPTGSFTVGRRLVESLYGGVAPYSTVYSFVSLAGVSGKMSGSAGGAAIPATALDVLEPALVRWLYARRAPDQSFAIGRFQAVEAIVLARGRHAACEAAPPTSRAPTASRARALRATL